MMSANRRSVIAGLSALPLAGAWRPALAAAPATRFPIWPGTAPGMPAPAIADAFVRRSPNGSADDIAWPHVAVPMLTVCPAIRPTGAAILMIPGGGYARVATGREPSAVARWFAGRGVTAFELLYRLPHDGWAAGADTPLQDAQRAMRVIRARAADWGVDPGNVATIGFSAGGHLAARLASRSTEPTYSAVDEADRGSPRPLVTGLLFPVITMMSPLAHEQSRRELLGPAPAEATCRHYSPEYDLPADMPPTLLGHAADDPVVKAGNSLVLFAALQARAIPSELYIVEKGGHGPPLVDETGKPHFWLERFALFAARHGLRL